MKINISSKSYLYHEKEHFIYKLCHVDGIYQKWLREKTMLQKMHTDFFVGLQGIHNLWLVFCPLL